VRSSRANRCQFRLNFRGLAASTGATNVVSFYSADNSSGQPQLTVTYDYP
jgi:hypothetical protein